MIYLGIDTSNSPLAIALAKDDTILIEETSNLKINHSLTAMPAVEDLMAKAKVNPSELTHIAVAEGPGSYTGVRIGLTIAKTLAWSLKIPLHMVSSLKVLAANGQFFDGIICPLMDARRGTAFMGAYAGESLESVIPDQHSDVREFLLQLKETGRPVLFVGMDIEIHKETIREALGDQAVFAAPQNRLPRASNLIMLAKQSTEQNVHHAVPEYRRITEAEANYLKAQGGGES
ncbi:tRNA (adenosine(37)-N6)-threonylcarbamoyltransferase complex dimerization subunit type 1 TsaB [Planococcus halotolerans]|uniref:tRNA (Adenosine(37)-N6)-threonylcarbamoyltransferase complex dimerization subunit type 1 TsaB n=1 Tax=Planococcus halotolerans TaxID=2233542 RepID=A0A365KWK9_9BACL|nr:tRNA (adenosine(37)-N6)-threonylcarbamoyltransferase complex dimerization subunit type 1 TsaB [Planococcus halotolerans]QHJ69239.1 tRNA (adenosine(37)-N6)-threonylcarbamoyltransferase complex dimerization subunit type 1 TsaB [Planococcus halotolerans]RAZ77575.1 tRNA (adenosine(37)-N6)-threonylcarbamoyltransferase complex dimerization subunit type 1 TsaB [Planococcus halotolerans]